MLMSSGAVHAEVGVVGSSVCAGIGVVGWCCKCYPRHVGSTEYQKDALVINLWRGRETLNTNILWQRATGGRRTKLYAEVGVVGTAVSADLGCVSTVTGMIINGKT